MISFLMVEDKTNQNWSLETGRETTNEECKSISLRTDLMIKKNTGATKLN